MWLTPKAAITRRIPSEEPCCVPSFMRPDGVGDCRDWAAAGRAASSRKVRRRISIWDFSIVLHSGFGDRRTGGMSMRKAFAFCIAAAVPLLAAESGALTEVERAF